MNITPHKDWYLQGTDGSYELYEELVKEPNIRLEVEHTYWQVEYNRFIDIRNFKTGLFTWNYRIYPNPLKELEVGQKVLIIDTWRSGIVQKVIRNWVYYIEWKRMPEDRENLMPLNE